MRVEGPWLVVEPWNEQDKEHDPDVYYWGTLRFQVQPWQDIYQEGTMIYLCERSGTGLGNFDKTPLNECIAMIEEARGNALKWDVLRIG